MSTMYWLVDNELQQNRNTALRKTVVTKCLPDFFYHNLRKLFPQNAMQSSHGIIDGPVLRLFNNELMDAMSWLLYNKLHKFAILHCSAKLWSIHVCQTFSSKFAQNVSTKCSAKCTVDLKKIEFAAMVNETCRLI